MSAETQGARETGEAVLIGTLIAVATALVNWGVERLRACVDQQRHAGEERCD